MNITCVSSNYYFTTFSSTSFCSFLAHKPHNFFFLLFHLTALTMQRMSTFKHIYPMRVSPFVIPSTSNVLLHSSHILNLHVNPLSDSSMTSWRSLSTVQHNTFLIVINIFVLLLNMMLRYIHTLFKLFVFRILIQFHSELIRVSIFIYVCITVKTFSIFSCTLWLKLSNKNKLLTIRLMLLLSLSIWKVTSNFLITL